MINTAYYNSVKNNLSKVTFFYLAFNFHKVIEVYIFLFFKLTYTFSRSN